MLIRRFVQSTGLLAAAALIVAPAVVSAAPARQSGQEVTVLVGAGQDTSQLLNYFPASVRVHAGDTVTWKVNGDELHTVAFTKGALFPPFPAARAGPGRPGKSFRLWSSRLQAVVRPT